MNRSIWNFWFVFGLVFAVIGLLILLNQAILRVRCTERTTGMIVNGNLQNREFALMLTFTANGEEYRLPFSHSNKMSAGMAVTVAYSPHKIDGYWNSFYIVEDTANTGIMAIICIIGGIIFMLGGYGVSIGLFTEVWHI